MGTMMVLPVFRLTILSSLIALPICMFSLSLFLSHKKPGLNITDDNVQKKQGPPAFARGP
jgi:hypothetical protein